MDTICCNDYYTVDVIETSKVLMLHQPTFSYPLPHPLFLMPKNMCLIEKNTLRLLNKSLTYDIPCLKGK